MGTGGEQFLGVGGEFVFLLVCVWDGGVLPGVTHAEGTGMGGRVHGGVGGGQA